MGFDIRLVDEEAELEMQPRERSGSQSSGDVLGEPASPAHARAYTPTAGPAAFSWPRKLEPERLRVRKSQMRMRYSSRAWPDANEEATAEDKDQQLLRLLREFEAACQELKGAGLEHYLPPLMAEPNEAEV